MIFRLGRLWKDIMEYIFPDFLRFVVEEVDVQFDLGKEIIFLDKALTARFHYPEKGRGTRIVDKLALVPLGEGGEALIHVEIQGYTKLGERPFFGERMFHNFYKIFDRYKRPIGAISVNAGSDEAVLRVSYVCQFLDTEVRYKFKTIRLQDLTHEALVGNGNNFSLVLVIARLAF